MHEINNLFRLLWRGKPKYIWAGLRRRFLYYFKRDYVNACLARRRGMCSGIGHCCSFVIPWCPQLQGDKCSVYSSQPLFCQIFPIDERDKELSNVKDVCGYCFMQKIA